MKNERPTAALAAPKHWMDAYGIKYEERLTVTKAQLELKMRPCFSLKTRIWADGILHSAGYQGEHAQMMKGGHKIAVQTADIADDLMKAAAKYYRDAGILLDKAAYEALRPGTQEMRRAIADMEEDGICERRYKGKPVRDMPLKERQARLNGKIDLYFWLRPRKAQADIVRQEYEQARETETTPPDFSATRVINHLQAESKRLSLFILHLEPSKQETITKAWDEFVQVFKKCIPEVDNQTPPEVVTERPPSINEEIVEEKSEETSPTVGREPLGNEPLARPMAWHQNLRDWLQSNSPVATHLDDAMLERIVKHLTPETVEQFQEAARKVKFPRKWAVYETVAEQVSKRGPLPDHKPNSKADEYAKRKSNAA